MYCTKCGAKNADNVKFCVECGAKLDAGEPTVTTPEETKKQVKSKNPKMIFAIVGILVVIVLAAVIVPRVTGAGSPEKKVIKAYMKALETDDASKLTEFLPKDIMDWMEKVESGTIENTEADMQDFFDVRNNYLSDTYGENWKISYKIKKVTDLSQDQVDKLNSIYNGDMQYMAEVRNDSELDAIEIEISEAKKIEVEVTYKGNDKKDTKSIEIDLVKIDKQWALDIETMREGLFY